MIKPLKERIEIESDYSNGETILYTYNGIKKWEPINVLNDPKRENHIFDWVHFDYCKEPR